MLVLVPAWLTLGWVTMALGVKRLHDRDRPSWWLLLSLVPILNVWLLVEVGFLAGTPGANRYGPDPKTGG
ncbi:MAG: hypothetical protein RLZZ450_2486 [Pseudomonadota bacterium]|jgi:uncharacterized membrane protein YhaH (DUF805 family)